MIRAGGGEKREEKENVKWVITGRSIYRNRNRIIKGDTRYDNKKNERNEYFFEDFFSD